MDKLESLRKTADEMLGKIEPNNDSFQKILLGKQENKRPKIYIRALSIACSFALVFGIGYIGVNKLFKAKDNDSVILHQSMGESNEEMQPMNYSLAAVPKGSVVAVKKTNKIQRLWVGGKKPFPMLCINGDVYRLIKGSVNNSLLGSSLGTVDSYNEDISSLDINKGISSNIADIGSEVFSINGMEDAAIAVKLDGQTRLFQRSSFAGNALRSGESLLSTLGTSRIVSIHHSSLGLVDDESSLSNLVTLLAKASKKGNGTSSGNESLVISFENGIKFQLGIKGNVLYGCGSFSADEFIDAFNKLAENE